MSEYEDGAYYWVKLNGEWSVGVFEAARSGVSAYDLWHCLAEDGYSTAEDFDEIGPCIGAEPPHIAGARAAMKALAPFRDSDPNIAQLLDDLAATLTPPAAPASAASLVPAPEAAAD